MMSSTAILSSVDLMLRGGVVVLLVLVAALLFRDYARNAAARLGALFALGSAAHAICSTNGVHIVAAAWFVPVRAVAAGNGFVFFLFARALFDDSFRPHWRDGAIWIAIVLAALVCGLALVPAVSTYLMVLLILQAIGFALLAAAQTLSTWREDLIEPRRRLRLFIVGAAAGHMIVTALAGALTKGPASVGTNIFEACVLLAIAGIVAWSLLRVAGDDLLFLPARDVARERVPEPVEPALVSALTHAMRIERIYRQDGLTIARLAHRQNLTEHKLRRLINQGLGYRNFNAFLNHYRIEDAKDSLADPSQKDVPILTIALDAGFTSLGPFNRAFREQAGMTPTEFRRARLGQEPSPEKMAPARATIPASASRISNSA